MNNDPKINVILSAESKVDKALNDAKKQVTDFKKSTENLNSAFKGMATIGAVAFGAIAAATGFAVKQAAEAEQGQAQLGAVLRSTAGAAGVSAEMANNLASSLSQLSTYSDDAIISAENLLLTFTNITKDVFPDTIQTVLDMSTALGQDLQSSATQLGKALQDPINGVTALRKVGVNFSESQQDMIKKLVETGKGMEAQKLILKELATEFGGSALAKAKTFGGAMTILKNNLNEVAEAIGNALLPSLKDAGESINDVVVKVINWINEHPDLVRAIVVATATLAALVAILGVVGAGMLAAQAAAIAFGTTLAALAGPIGWIIGAITLVSAGAGIAAYKFGDMKDATKGVEDTVSSLNARMPSFSGGIEDAGNQASESAKKLAQLKKELKSLFDDVNNINSDSAKSIGEAFVEQEQNIASIQEEIEQKKLDIKKAKNEEGAADSIKNMKDELDELESKLEKEQAAYNRNIELRKQNEAAYEEARRRAAETAFERQLEDILQERAERLKATIQKIQDKKEEINALISEEARFTSETVNQSNRRIDQYKKEAEARISLSKTTSSSAIGSIGNTANSTPAILPKRAYGGEVSSGVPYMVGERGPETFVPNVSGNIIPNGGGGISIYISGNTLLDDDAGSKIAEQIMRTLKTNLLV